MKRSTEWSSQWIFYVTAGFLFGAAVLRSLLIFRDSPALSQILGLLMTWLVLFASETAISRKWSGYFAIYLALQTGVVVLLLSRPGFTDFFAVMFAVLSMQVMQRLNLRQAALVIGLFAPLTAAPLVKTYGASQALIFAMIHTALNAFLAVYALATRRAQAARAQNQALMQQLQEANRQLQAYSKQLERLAVTRERHRLARELHDSVPQTIFSMTLTTQSALLLVERDPSRVGAQLDRLTQLAQGALSEMRVLISELRPEKVAEGGLVAALRRHLADRPLPENLLVSVEVEGDLLARLSPAEEQSLFRIAQEALNNVVKHAQASRACIRLQLAEPPWWIEIYDDGRGFDLRQTRNGGRVGLVSMNERAAEIGWDLQITTSPGAGTCVRVGKKPSAGRQP